MSDSWDDYHNDAVVVVVVAAAADDDDDDDDDDDGSDKDPKCRYHCRSFLQRCQRDVDACTCRLNNVAECL